VIARWAVILGALAVAATIEGFVHLAVIATLALVGLVLGARLWRTRP
jgi:hypothetical protein